MPVKNRMKCKLLALLMLWLSLGHQVRPTFLPATDLGNALKAIVEGRKEEVLPQFNSRHANVEEMFLGVLQKAQSSVNSFETGEFIEGVASYTPKLNTDETIASELYYAAPAEHLKPKLEEYLESSGKELYHLVQDPAHYHSGPEDPQHRLVLKGVLENLISSLNKAEGNIVKKDRDFEGGLEQEDWKRLKEAFFSMNGHVRNYYKLHLDQSGHSYSLGSLSRPRSFGGVA